MKLLFENAWKKFVEDATPEMEEYLKKHPYMEMDGLQEIERTGGMPSHLDPKKIAAHKLKEVQEVLDEHMPRWVALKKLGEGASAPVYLIENQHSGERRALKMVDPDHSGYYDTEKSSYEWVMLNRDSLPDDVKKYLPIVQQVHEVPVFKYSTMLLITMEVLKPLPKQVVSDLLAGENIELSDTKEDRILSDYDSVKEVVSHIVSKSLIMRQIISDEIGLAASRDVEGLNLIANIEKSALEMFYTGKAPANVASAIPTTMGQKAKELIASVLVQAQKRLEIDPSLFMALVRDLEQYARHQIGAFVVPIHAGEQAVWAGQSGKSAMQQFPEATGIIDAINYLQKSRDVTARDIHHKNVMMRPSTGDMVIMDLGLFFVGEST